MKQFLFLVCLISFFSITACSKKTKSSQSTFTPSAKIPPYGYLCPMNTRRDLISSLRQSGLKVVLWGDRIILTLPSDNFFNGRSLQVIPQSKVLLSQVAKLLACYQKEFVFVIAYTDLLSTDKLNKALSRLQAQEVMRYLEIYGANARVITAVGGGKTPVVDRAAGNRRIEVMTRKLP